MDADSSDTGAVVTDSLNGETKPDPAKLAQSAIIKQDVMLSGTSTQSPVSSVLAMPTISMPGASMPTVSMGSTSLHASLPDSLFLSAVPSLGNDGLHSVTDSKHDLAASQTASVLSQQLLGQPQVAPQFIMTGQGLHGQPSAASAASMPVQQLLIPVSTGNGTQQFVSIPVSMAPGSNQQIQLLTTSNGQIIATNLANLTQQLTMALAGAGNTAHSTSVNTTASQTPSLSVNNGHVSSQPHASSPQAAAAAASASTALPQLITNSQGQIIALGSSAQPQATQTTKHVSHGSFNHQHLLQQQHQLQQALATTSASTTVSSTLSQSSSQQASALSSPSAAQLALTQQALQAAVGASMPVTQVAQSIKQSLTSLSQSGLQSVSLPQGHSLKMAPMAAAVAAQTIQAAVATQPSALVQQQVVAAVTQSSTNHSLPPNVNQLLPNTVSNATESTTVDGINLDEIKEFAKQFKIRRLSLGLTQTQVGQALSATEGPAYSQSAICRFEKLDITPKSAQKIKPVLEKWMKEAEERYKNGVQNLTDFIGSEPSKKRKRRTSFTPQAIEILNEFFERNTHPSGAEMTELAEKLNYDREVIRVWFCNKRQALKNTIKKLKS